MPTRNQTGPARSSLPIYLGQRLREARCLRGFRQRHLASFAALDESALSRYESGTYCPSVKRLWALARGLGLPVDALLPPLDLPTLDDRELYAMFRRIWFQPPDVRAAAAAALRTVQFLPLAAGLEGGHHASRC
jgi:transcriptional regulator with XRE-family HTH domain